ncbi:hypothetical protein M407DRAFT_240854 [Tulasnella calospora MUT 4182]|uniref:Uncharacterized protein n=1 Tax=Tulasnella calospora MUT 4182 TaxID=1051891 RepID=A0A0C3LIZ5_9AGAM|nr:hypothetical protein M407DRAFT_240854 [Tulasnella calospora MUT 4182]
MANPPVIGAPGTSVYSGRSHRRSSSRYDISGPTAQGMHHLSGPGRASREHCL